jgi:hypothetical protein
MLEVSSWENHREIRDFHFPYKKLWKITMFNGKIHYFYGETLEHLLGSMADHPQMGQWQVAMICHVGARYRALENTHLLKHRPRQ